MTGLYRLSCSSKLKILFYEKFWCFCSSLNFKSLIMSSTNKWVFLEWIEFKDNFWNILIEKLRKIVYEEDFQKEVKGRILKGWLEYKNS